MIHTLTLHSIFVFQPGSQPQLGFSHFYTPDHNILPGAEAVPLRNALMNITNDDPVYNVVADSMLHVVKDLVAQLGERISVDKDIDLSDVVIDDRIARILGGDSYFVWYSMLPLVRRERLEPAIIEGWRQFLRNVVGSEEWRKIHEVTRLDPVKSAAMAARLLATFLRRVIEEAVSSAERSGDSALRVVNVLLEGGNCRRSQGIASRAAAKAAKQFIDDVKPDGGEELRKMLSEIADFVKHAAQQRRDVEKHEGGGVGGASAGTKPGELALAAKLAALLTVKRLEDIVILGGRIESKFRFWRSTRTESRRGQPDGYTLTSNPAKALPREHALPDELWYAKLTNGKWLTKRRVQEKLGMLIVAVDKSGSMAADGRNVWARSVAYALLKLALKRRQPIALMLFDHDVYGPWTDPAEAMEMLLKVTDVGGTCIDCAIRRGLELLERYRDRSNTLVVITDGDDYVKTQPETLKKRNARLVAVMIQGDNVTLERLARASGGQYLKAELTEDDALRIVDAAL